MATARSSMVALLMVLGLLQSVSAKTYTVGDTTGWTVPSTTTFYDDWAAKQNFVVGDKLVFNFASSAHNVYQVSVADAIACDGTKPIDKFTDSGATVTLSQSGTIAFICEVQGHCGLGMKMTVDVSLPSPAPPTKAPTKAPSKTPAAVPAKSPLAATAPSQAPVASTPSAASGLQSGAAMVIAVFVSAVAAFAL